MRTSRRPIRTLNRFTRLLHALSSSTRATTPAAVPGSRISRVTVIALLVPRPRDVLPRRNLPIVGVAEGHTEALQLPPPPLLRLSQPGLQRLRPFVELVQCTLLVYVEGVVEDSATTLRATIARGGGGQWRRQGYTTAAPGKKVFENGAAHDTPHSMNTFTAE